MDKVTQLIAECRDTLSVALPYVGGSGFGDAYAGQQVKEQIKRCEIYLEQQPKQPAHGNENA